MSITRRLFLRNTAAAGAVGTSIAAPAVAAKPEMSDRDKAIWHMREIERLILGSGADAVHIAAIGTYGHHSNVRLIGIHYEGHVMDRDGVFAPKGDVA